MPLHGLALEQVNSESIDSSAVDVTGIQSLPWTPRSSIYADTLVNKISSAIN